jgi:hypothetical protein
VATTEIKIDSKTETKQNCLVNDATMFGRGDCNIPNNVKEKSWLEWLECHEGRVFCSVCKQMKGKISLLVKQSDVREDSAFTSDGVVALTSKKLLKKIDKHSKSTRHISCQKNIDVAAENAAKAAFSSQVSRFAELNAKKIEATEKVFRVAYLCVKENMAFTKHQQIIKCHELNGVWMGSLLYSRIACHDIVTHIASDMRKDMIKYIIDTKTKISVMVDESTTKSVKCALIIYVRFLFDNEVTNYFLDLVELQDKTGSGIANCVLSSLANCGLPAHFLKSNLIGFCSDGASAMTGIYSGAAVTIQDILGIKLCTFHCMAHRLELAVHSVVKSMNQISHYQIMCQEFHNIYALSSKRLLQLEVVAKEISVQIFKIGKVFDVRWLMSSYNAVNALWKDYVPLQHHMNNLAKDTSLSGKERAKFTGLKRKLAIWSTAAEMALMRDVLLELSRFSLHLQHRNTTVMTVGDHLKITLHALAAMKESFGTTMNSVMTAVTSLPQLSTECDTTAVSLSREIILPGTGISVKSPLKKELDAFETFRKQFIQGLIDNITSRFPDVILKTVPVLDMTTWPEDDVSRTLYGDADILELAQNIRFEVLCYVTSQFTISI